MTNFVLNVDDGGQVNLGSDLDVLAAWQDMTRVDPDMPYDLMAVTRAISETVPRSWVDAVQSQALRFLDEHREALQGYTIKVLENLIGGSMEEQTQAEAQAAADKAVADAREGQDAEGTDAAQSAAAGESVGEPSAEEVEAAAGDGAAELDDDDVEEFEDDEDEEADA